MITFNNSYELDQLAQILAARLITQKCCPDTIALAKLITINQGSGITITGTAAQKLSGSPTWAIAHADTSNVVDLTTNTLEVIDTMNFDEFGHVISYTLKTISAGGSSLTATQIGFGNVSNSLSGSANFVYDSTNTRVGIGASISPIATLDIKKDGVDTTTQSIANGILLENSSVASTTGLNYVTPPIVFSVNARKTLPIAASQSVKFMIDTQGNDSLSAANGILRVSSSVNGASFTTRLRLNAAGSFLDMLNIQGTLIGVPSASGTSNMAWGINTLAGLSTGTFNIGIGQNALQLNSIGIENVAIGLNTLTNSNTDNNTAIGSWALNGNTTGFANTAIGKNALLSNTTGAKNTSVGAGSMENTTTGGFNVAIGEDALLHNTTGTNNIAIGWLSGALSTAGIGNTSIGFNAGTLVSSGDSNIFLGRSAGNVGGQAASVTNSIAIGANSFTTASNQMVLGNNSLTQAIMYGVASGTGTKALRYDDSTGIITYTSDSSLSVPISNLLAAIGNNDIDNGDNQQVWRANSLGSGHTAFSIRTSGWVGTGPSANAGLLWLYNDSSALASGGNSTMGITVGAVNANSGVTSTGMFIDVANNGASSKNIALQLNAAGATTNYALIAPAGIVGIGTISPTATQLQVNVNNVSGTTTTSGIVEVMNSLTTGTGHYISSSSLTTGSALQLVSTSTVGNGFSLLNILSSGSNSTASKTVNGGSISITNTGTTSTNIGLSITTSGASNNYPLKLVDGNQASGKVLTSDASGNANWQTASSFSLSNGNLTTANGTAVDLGGAATGNTLLSTSSNTFTIDGGGDMYFGDQSIVGNNTGILITDAAATISLKAVTQVEIDSRVFIPKVDSTTDLGSASHQFKDLYLTGASIYMSGSKILATAGLTMPSSSIIDFGSGNVTMTHTSGILTMGTGDFRVTTAGTNSASVVTVGGTQTLTNKSIAIGSITGLGTGVATWLVTPSWTNFNSAITGTAPYWSLASGGTLTGTNTITATTNPIIFSSTVAAGTGATAAWQFVDNSLTTGNGMDISSSSISSGNIVKITSTSTAATSSTLTGLNVAISGANSTTAQTVTGIQSAVTNTNATSGTNIAGLLKASGATTTNWALFTGSSTGGDGRINVNNATNDANHVMVIKGLDNTAAHGVKILSNNETANMIVAWDRIQTSAGMNITASSSNITLSTLSTAGVGVNVTPTSALHTTSFAVAYAAKTTTYPITATDSIIEATSGTFTTTLPTAVGIAGRIYTITNSGSGVLTLATTSSQTFVNVSGTPTTLTLNQFNSVTVVSNNANWLRIANI